MDTVRLAAIGGGNHSRKNHLPSLARYVAEHPGEVELAAFCDLDPEVAGNACSEYGFSKSYTNVEEMLSAEDLDGCVSVTPIPVTAAVANQVIAAGVPVLMEKPPGSTPEEVKEICELTSGPDARAMVSMNRRFDPSVSASCAWRGDRPLEYVRGVMLRHNRKEETFFLDTAIHSLDAIRHIAGDIADYSAAARRLDGVRWYSVRLEFESGALGILEVMPSCGTRAERYEMLGTGYRVRASVGETDSGEYTAWENGEQVLHDEPARGMPGFVRNGTFAETVEFISALKEDRAPFPAPAQVRQSVDICRQIQYETA
jgi:predicted dehydrogenase